MRLYVVLNKKGVKNKRLFEFGIRPASFEQAMKRIASELNKHQCDHASVTYTEKDEDSGISFSEDFGDMYVKNTGNGPTYHWDNSKTDFAGTFDSGKVDPRTGYVTATRAKKKPVKAAPTVMMASRPVSKPVPVPKPKRTESVKPVGCGYVASIHKAKEPSKPKEKPITVDGLRLKGTSFYQVITKRKLGGKDTTSIVYSDFDPRNAFRELIAHQRKSKKPYTLLAGYVTAGGSPEYGNPDRSGKYTVIPGKDIGMTGTYLKEIVRNETRYYKILRNGMFLPIRK